MCWGVGGRCGKVEGWENMEEVWESVLGVGESEKRCGKVCYGVGKYWGRCGERCGGVEMCDRVWEVLEEVWGV